MSEKREREGKRKIKGLKRDTECDNKTNGDTYGKMNTDIEHMTDRESLTEEETN